MTTTNAYPRSYTPANPDPTNTIGTAPPKNNRHTAPHYAKPQTHTYPDANASAPTAPGPCNGL